MKQITKKVTLCLMMFFVLVSFTKSTNVSAASTPSLGMASSFSILSSTYTNTVIGTTINGNLGYTTPPAVNPTVNGTTHIANITYNQAGVSQGVVLADLNGQACTFTFAPGAIDLATDITHGAVGVYLPGVYCTTGAGAATIGVGGITLSGSGTYIFRINGALDTVANANIALTNSASPCDVFWTPIAATTFGANTVFVGNVIDDAGITLGANTIWTGIALAFGGTVTTDTDTIIIPICIVPHIPGSGNNGLGDIAVFVSVPTIISTPIVLLSAPTPIPVITSTPSTLTTGTMAPVFIPLLPNTGFPPNNSSNNSSVYILSAITIVFASMFLNKRKSNKV